MCHFREIIPCNVQKYTTVLIISDFKAIFWTLWLFITWQEMRYCVDWDKSDPDEIWYIIIRESDCYLPQENWCICPISNQPGANFIKHIWQRWQKWVLWSSFMYMQTYLGGSAPLSVVWDLSREWAFFLDTLSGDAVQLVLKRHGSSYYILYLALS